MTASKQMTTTNKTRQALVLLALSLAIANCPLALAQGLEAGQMGTLSQSGALAPDQDSLLPPEVVPVDPAVAAKMQMTQAALRANSGEGTQAPGMIGGGQFGQFNGMQSAKDFRKAAFESLMNQGPNQWNGQFPQSAPAPQMNASAQGMQATAQQPGQSGWVAPGTGGDQNAVASHHQSQTLTGGVKTPVVRRDTKRGGFSNAFSAMSGFGSAVMLGGFAGGPTTALGLGMFGLGATGFGTRNGFRF